MKIGIYNPYMDGLTGGEKYMLTLASSLSKKHIVTIFWDDALILKKAEEKFGLDLSHVSTTSNIFSSRTPLHTRLLESKKYDAIVVLSDGSIPTVLTKLFLHFQFPVEWVSGRSIKNKIKIARVSGVFCNSQFTKKYIDKTFGINSSVLYPPIQIKLEKVKKTNIILNVGRFGRTIEGNNYKKQDVMIESFKKVIDTGTSDWKFVLVVSLRDEDTERFQKLRNIAEGYPIEFVINPSDKELWKYYHSAKIYWHASGYGEDLIKHPEYAEHFGMSTVEAMGAGVVPVVIDAGGQCEIVEDGKTGYLWRSTDELITKTNVLINDAKLLQKMSDLAQERSSDFSVSQFDKHVQQIILHEN